MLCIILDRTHGQQFKREFDESARCLEELIKTITKEIKERTELILLLEQSEIYYDNQRAEAKVVANVSSQTILPLYLIQLFFF